MAPRCYAIGPFLLGTISLALSVAGSLWCRTFEVEIANAIPNSSGIIPKFETGIFLYRDTEFVADNQGLVIEQLDTCRAYDGDAWSDTKWKVAALTQLASWFIAVVLVTSLLFAACCQCTVWYYRGIGACFWCVVTVLDGMLFWAMQSNLCNGNNPLLSEEFDTQSFPPQSCTLGTTAWFVVGSLVGYFFTGILCFLLGRTEGATMAKSGKEEKKSVFAGFFFCFQKKDNDVEEKIAAVEGEEDKQMDETVTLDATREDEVEIDDEAEELGSAAAGSTGEEQVPDEENNTKASDDDIHVEEESPPLDESVEIDVDVGGSITVGGGTTTESTTTTPEEHLPESGTLDAPDKQDN